MLCRGIIWRKREERRRARVSYIAKNRQVYLLGVEKKYVATFFSPNNKRIATPRYRLQLKKKTHIHYYFYEESRKQKDKEIEKEI